LWGRGGWWLAARRRDRRRPWGSGSCQRCDDHEIWPERKEKDEQEEGRETRATAVGGAREWLSLRKSGGVVGGLSGRQRACRRALAMVAAGGELNRARKKKGSISYCVGLRTRSVPVVDGWPLLSDE
jgi:hypothetical protein